jgi:hypothetical protein
MHGKNRCLSVSTFCVQTAGIHRYKIINKYCVTSTRPNALLATVGLHGLHDTNLSPAWQKNKISNQQNEVDRHDINLMNENDYTVSNFTEKQHERTYIVRWKKRNPTAINIGSYETKLS